MLKKSVALIFCFLLLSGCAGSGNVITETVEEPPIVPFVPWSTTFETDSMVQAAISETDKFFGVVSPNSSYELTFEDDLLDSNRLWITEVLDYVNGSFSKFNIKKVKAFIGTTHKWSKEILEESNLWVGDPRGTFPCSDGIEDVYCVEKNIIVIVRSDPSWGAGNRSTVAHEFFHTVQYSLTGPQFTVHGGPMTDLTPKRIPRWLIEGSANYYAIYVNQKLKLSTYQELRQDQVSNSTYSRDALEPLDQYDYLGKPELNPYGIGQAATEYLIASVGFESFLNIFIYTNSEGSFPKGFKKAVGIDIDDFYLKFKSASGSMEIGR